MVPENISIFVSQGDVESSIEAALMDVLAKNDKITGFWNNTVKEEGVCILSKK